jgi:putative transposase
LTTRIDLKSACDVVGRSRATHYRRLQLPKAAADKEVRQHHRALSEHERACVITQLNSERFCDQAPAQVWATLLDEGTYLCSISSMYRILREQHQVRERRAQATRPALKKPELMASAPNQVWSWDITKLKGPHKWTWFHLYVILDIYSRKVVGWHVSSTESARQAEALIAEACGEHDIEPGQLSLHADRGSSMTSKPVAFLLADLGVTQSHSRPHTSNDNPFSESQFKTLKYCPAFPDRFSSLQHAREFCEGFFDYYNHEHRHSGIGLHTPDDVHSGRVTEIQAKRTAVLDAAYAKNPNRFVRSRPKPPQLPEFAWINEPVEEVVANS